MLTPAQIAHYHDRGWLVVESVFTRDEADHLAELAWEITQRELEHGESSMGARDRTDDGGFVPRKLEQPYRKHPDFGAVALDPRLTTRLGELVGEPALFCSDQLFMKPPKFGSAKPYHQDNYYFRCRPADHVITAWIALDDVDEANGCLRYIDGSHREGIRPHTPIPGEPHNLAVAGELVDLSRESLAVVGKGGVVFHHGEVLHTSHRNQSGRWRRAYATHWVTDDVTSDGLVVRNAYYHELLTP